MSRLCRVACVRKTSPEITRELWHFLDNTVCDSVHPLINKFGHKVYSLAMDDGLIAKETIIDDKGPPRER